MSNHNVEIVFTEKYEIERSAVISMNDKEYSNYINGNVELDSLISRSDSFEQFKDKYKMNIKNKKSNGFKLVKTTLFNQDLKGRVLIGFDVQHLNSNQ